MANGRALLKAYAHRPIALRRDMADAAAAILWDADDLAQSAAQFRAAGFAAGSADVRRLQGGAVAIVPVYGMILHRSAFCGTSTVGLRSMVGQAMADPNVGAILLEFDSPGGIVDNVPETADFLYSLRGQKPMGAIVNTEACSAAYWLASQCDEILCTPSGMVGSVGVYLMHVDESGANDQAGLKFTYVYAGQYKVEGNPDEPLDPAAQAFLQSQIDASYQQFTSAVARGRGLKASQVTDTYGQGRALMAKSALAAGMVNRICTFDDAVTAYAKKAQAGTKRSAALGASAPVLAGVIPQDVSEHLAPKDTPWARPTLADFTDKGWDELDDTKKRHIAGHYAWAKEMPPLAFGSLVLPHHRPSDGDVVFKGVVAAAGRLDQSEIPATDKPRVKAHLRHHYQQFDEPIPDSLKGEDVLDLELVAARQRMELALDDGA